MRRRRDEWARLGIFDRLLPAALEADDQMIGLDLADVRVDGCTTTAVCGGERLPVIRLNDLRHTHATLLLAAGEPVKVVSERLGHANATITLTVHQHVHPGVGRQAAGRFAALLDG
jgi:hypothetical protein